MDRRQFTKAAGFTGLSAGAALALAAVVGNAPAVPQRGPGPTPAPTPAPTPPPTPVPTLPPVAMGTNLSGMEWARPGLRYGQSTKPGGNVSGSRAEDVRYL